MMFLLPLKDKYHKLLSMRAFFLFFLFIFYFISNPISLQAAEPTSRLTLAELIDIALDNNLETQRVWLQAKKASAAVGLAKSAYYPKVDLETYIQNGRDFKFINGPDVNYTIIGADLILGWMLYDFGERSAQFEAAKCALVSADWQYNQALQQVMLDVLEIAYGVLHAEECLAASLISSQEAAFMRDAARELNFAGLIPISDVYSSEAAFSQMQIMMLEYRSLVEIEKGRLALILGRSPFEKIELAKVDKLPVFSEPAQNNLLQLAQGKRADFFAKQAKLSEADFLYKKTAAEFRPKFYFSGKGGYNRAIEDRSNGAQYAIALNLDIPLFDGFENTQKLYMKRADVRSSEVELAALELEIAFEILKYSTQMQALQDMLTFANDNLKNAEKAYAGVLDMYKAGTERITEVAVAHKVLSQARILYSDIKTRWLASSAHLAFSVGILLEEPQCY